MNVLLTKIKSFMKRIKKMKKYSGAGLLLVRKKDNRTEVCLGLRAIKPHKGYWSVPGGKKEKDESFWECAVRETKEEFFSGRNELLENLDIEKSDKRSVFLFPFFEYHTYVIDVTGKDIVIKHNWEFRKVKWFDVNKLPYKTHIGVKVVLRRFEYL